MFDLNKFMFVCSLLKLRQSLDALLNDMKNLPARLKQYSSFEYVQKTIKTYLKVIFISSLWYLTVEGFVPNTQ